MSLFRCPKCHIYPLMLIDIPSGYHYAKCPECQTEGVRTKKKDRAVIRWNEQVSEVTGVSIVSEKETFSNFEDKESVTLEVHDHEVMYAFGRDGDAQSFRDFMEEQGWKLFTTYLEDHNDPN